MEPFTATIVVIIQLAVAGFLAWGGWLVLKDGYRGLRTDAAAGKATASTPPAPVDDFERVASLVLLALLCTTLAATV